MLYLPELKGKTGLMKKLQKSAGDEYAKSRCTLIAIDQSGNRSTDLTGLPGKLT